MVRFLLSVAAVILCLTVHEVSHGLAAWLLGDPTAKSRRRLSLNPLRHLDLMGTLMMLMVGFGWARPVPVDMRYFKRPKLGMAITALAGPMSNLILAFVAAVLYCFIYFKTLGTAELLLTLLGTVMTLSVGLGLFNLLPIPPLDGSKVLEGVLPDRIYYTILRYEWMGMLLLLLLLWSGVAEGPLTLARNNIVEFFLTVGEQMLRSLNS